MNAPPIHYGMPLFIVMNEDHRPVVVFADEVQAQIYAKAALAEETRIARKWGPKWLRLNRTLRKAQEDWRNSTGGARNPLDPTFRDRDPDKYGHRWVGRDYFVHRYIPLFVSAANAQTEWAVFNDLREEARHF